MTVNTWQTKLIVVRFAPLVQIFNCIFRRVLAINHLLLSTGCTAMHKKWTQEASISQSDDWLKVIKIVHSSCQDSLIDQTLLGDWNISEAINSATSLSFKSTTTEGLSSRQWVHYCGVNSSVITFGLDRHWATIVYITSKSSKESEWMRENSNILRATRVQASVGSFRE